MMTGGEERMMKEEEQEIVKERERKTVCEAQEQDYISKIKWDKWE